MKSRIVSISLSSFIFLVATLSSMMFPHIAKAGDFEVGAGIGWLADVGNGPDGHGFTLRLDAGYNYNPWVGFFLEQDLGGTFWKSSNAHFHGATIIALKVTYPNLEGFDLWGKLGLGGAYYARHQGGDDWSRGFFAFRLGIGATYKIDQHLGIGAQFNYTVCAGDSDDGHHFHKGSDNAHILDILIHLAYKF